MNLENDVIIPFTLIDNCRKSSIIINKNKEQIIKKEQIIEDKIIDTDKHNLSSAIYRFKFSEDFMQELYNFSKIHQYDERKDFKEAWNIWAEENNDIIIQESRRLINLDYDGDIMDKMFKSVRYYFRKKSTQIKEPRQRRQYISVSKELLEAMDKHITDNINDNNYQPKTGFLSFCKDYESLVKGTITTLFKNGIKDSELIQDKIKKTYKNRYFMLTKG
jgi:hypothetical protein